MNKENPNELIKTINRYIDNYYGKVTTNNAQQAIDEFNKFNEKWKEITQYIADRNSNRQSKYGIALVIYSVALYEQTQIKEIDITHLSDLIEEFDKNDDVKYQFGIKECLYFNLGSCWHKLGKLYDAKVLEAFKKHIYYLITLSSNTQYHPTAYAFRKCNHHLYQALINEQLNLSSPTTFNDPFDCPIRELLSKNDEITSLLRKAYNDCLKIACFSSNTKLPYTNDNDETINNEKKQADAPEEYLNNLMWAHYADYHRGICIKYHFGGSITQLGCENKNVVSYFKDIRYSSNDMSKYSQMDSISLEDAFFLKGKEWEYENELRYIHYDINSNSNYETVDIPNSIEAIYFGLKCSPKDKQTIQKIMKDKKLVIKGLDGKITEKPIEFYQMEIDEKHFGQIKALRI